METYKITYIIFVLFILQICTSCEKMIEVDTPDNQITSVQVFEDVQTANAALAGLYAASWDNSPLAGDQTGKLLGTYSDDLDYYASASTTGILELYNNTQADSNPTVYSYWSSAYQKIYIANAIIEGAEKSTTLPTTEKNRIKAEALLVRSILYYYLQQIFGDIPYPDTTNYQVNQSLAKIASSEVLTKLESDLGQSISLLVDEYRNTERIFPNRKVAQLMLAKVYMLQNKWSEAENLLKEIKQSPLYQFETNITKVFNKSGTHILWQLKPKNSGDATKEAAAYYFINAAPSNFALSQNLVTAFNPADLRKLNWTAAVSFNGTTWCRAEKYKNRTNNTTEYSIVFRLEEVYLLLAEALAQQNKIPEALPFLNATRQRAGLALLILPFSKETLLNEILLENRKEFFTEMGHRFLDLKRFNKLNTLFPVKQNWKDYHKFWPLPQKELLLNPNLNPQNNGY
ncbi:RagB/SusD family nutrient uptake outer membrane protein [Chryseobacterium sp. ISL-6]|uniref:RagB/SusD family nutrient uptake outer membrane protein n=1 Tax=Chryseobacterium sp. ISL-6 TaxID=2819143 RepID=UPI001BE64CC8|nr:RagB/SusD family nutrient uptake outer membrane protein [Chryseobacterium sp. ISL-6]MBT2621916.1 RagB/SusD family nutrient uptake outer membrane protein [Chryseobacterium sp. ISL-6]